MENIKQFHAAILADWSPAVETAARRIAAALVAVCVAGYVAGAWLHRLNDRLSAAYVAFLGLSEPVAAPVPAAEPEPAAEPVQWAVCYGLRSELPAAVAAPALASLTVAELRKIARATLGSSARIDGRRIAQATKSALLEALK